MEGDLESLRVLSRRESERDEEIVSEKLSNLLRVQQPEITSEDRLSLLKWIHEMCVEELPRTFDEYFRIPTLAVYTLDRFLESCTIRRPQLQLAGVVCASLAGKIVKAAHPGLDSISHEKLIHYSDGAVTPKEIKAWEMLVLSKLNWNLGRVLPQDYFEHWKRHPGIIKSDSDTVFKNAGLIIALAIRDKTFLDKTSSKLLAFTALNLALHEQSESRDDDDEAFALALSLDSETIRNTEIELETLLWSFLESSPRRFKRRSFTPPPDSSTPKSSLTENRERRPLTENSDRNPRKRLQSDFRDHPDKENLHHDDSAIGLNASGLTDLPGSAECSACSGGSSSAHSSPDSGASSTTSRKPLKAVDNSPRSSPECVSKENTPPKKWD